jgi:hypothetical protein
MGEVRRSAAGANRAWIMTGCARLVGRPISAVVLAVLLVTAGGGSAALAAPARASAATPSLVGKWSFDGGIFKFVKTGANTYKDVVIKKRTGVFCSHVNDKSGQMVMHKKSVRVYKGTWKWFFYSGCRSAGLGKTTIKLSRYGAHAYLTADPPADLTGTVEKATWKRLP